MQIYRISISVMLLAIMMACSGSGQSGSSKSGIGLSASILPERVSVVDPQSSASNKPIVQKSSAPGLALATGDISADTDYAADRTTVYVNERSLEAFNTVNEILCMLRQTKYDVMINAGPYRAQLDKNLCSNNRDSASKAGADNVNQSSGSTMPVYEDWVVNSYRTSMQSPHFVDVWAHSLEGPNGFPQTIFGRAAITEGADIAPPYGIFRINFKTLDPNNPSTVLFKAFLNAERDTGSGKVFLKFSAEDSNSYYIEKATLDKFLDNTGAGSVLTAITYTWTAPSIKRFNLAYDNNHFRRDEAGKLPVCLDRTQYDVSAWKYGLYTAQAPVGSSVKVNAGFPIKKDDAFGWIGYWGAWMPNGVALLNNETVLKHDYSTNSDTPYTVVKANGKLKKHIKHEVTLGEIRNVPLIWWDDSGNTYQIAWNSSAKKFYLTAQMAGSGSTWQSLPPDAFEFPLTSMRWFELGFWSQSLGGMVIVKFPPPTSLTDQSTTTANCGYSASSGMYDCSATATDSVPVIYFEENIVYPDDNVPATLACFDNCPDIVSLSTNSPFRADIASFQTTTPAGSIWAGYHFNPAAMLLYSGTSGTVPVITSKAGSNFSNGITSGPLFDPALLTAPSLTIPSLLGCDWAPFSTTCGSKAWSVLPVFYTWETGPNDWNHFTGLKDSLSNPVKFDKPLQVKYVHHAASPTAPDFKYDNVTFFLEYNGFGNLNGIPGTCVNIDDPAAPADCSDSGSDPAIRWVPEFTIPDIQPAGSPSAGQLTELTDIVNPTLTYIVKGLEKEERMRSAAGQCDSLPTTDYSLPSMSSYRDPAIGAEPSITGAPAVIGGVVQ